MGNWRTVHIIGECPADQLDALREACAYDERTYDNFHCLSVASGLMGLGDWPAEHIDASGNLAERDYEVADVADQLRVLRAVAPGLRVKVHCGGNWEDPVVVATVTCDDDGVHVRPPQAERVRGASADEALGRMFKALRGH